MNRTAQFTYCWLRKNLKFETEKKTKHRIETKIFRYAVDCIFRLFVWRPGCTICVCVCVRLRIYVNEIFRSTANDFIRNYETKLISALTLCSTVPVCLSVTTHDDDDIFFHIMQQIQDIRNNFAVSRYSIHTSHIHNHQFRSGTKLNDLLTFVRFDVGWLVISISPSIWLHRIYMWWDGMAIE